MARTHGRIYTSIWKDDDFRLLTKDAQRGYFLLLSQPLINNCGVLPYVPRKWVRLAPDESDTSLRVALSVLIGRRFIVLDEDTEELLVRTFIRHDRIAQQPKLKISAERQFTEIESRPIRVALLQEYPELFEPLATEDLRIPLPEPLWKDLSIPLPPETPIDTPIESLDAPTPAPTTCPTPKAEAFA